MMAIGFSNALMVHVVVYMTCQGCKRVSSAVFDHQPSHEEIVAARPVEIASCALNRWVIEATTVRGRARV